MVHAIKGVAPTYKPLSRKQLYWPLTLFTSTTARINKEEIQPSVDAAMRCCATPFSDAGWDTSTTT